MSALFRCLATLVLAASFPTDQARAQPLIQPPFGLRWSDSPEKLMDWASKHSLDVTLSLPGDQPALRVLRVQPRRGFLPGTQAASIEGRFLSGKLFELTIGYADPEASADLMTRRFEDLRQQLTAEHGPLLANQQKRSVRDRFVTRTQSFHREPVKGLFLLLAFTEVEDLLRQKSEARFSLIYRNENLKAELQSRPGLPERAE